MAKEFKELFHQEALLIWEGEKGQELKVKLGEERAFFFKGDRNNTACVTANGKINESMQRWMRGAAEVARRLINYVSPPNDAQCFPGIHF